MSSSPSWASIPPPRLRPIIEDRAEPWGYSVFEKIGCAACHIPRLGGINGLYSDLLLHDMGDSLGDAATYYGVPSSTDGQGEIARNRDRARESRVPALASEWRTPPLWGVADSAPYLHDGRARTIHQAIEEHGGEARETVARYGKLGRGERIALLRFLRSLTAAPSGAGPPRSTPSRRGAITRTPPTRENDPVGVVIRSIRGENRGWSLAPPRPSWPCRVPTHVFGAAAGSRETRRARAQPSGKGPR